MSEVQRLMDRCAGGLEIRVDGHLDSSRLDAPVPIEEYIAWVRHDEGNSMRASDEVVAEMIRRNRCVEVTAHRFSQNSHNDALHWSLDEAVRLVHESMDLDEKRKTR